MEQAAETFSAACYCVHTLVDPDPAADRELVRGTERRAPPLNWLSPRRICAPLKTVTDVTHDIKVL